MLDVGGIRTTEAIYLGVIGVKMPLQTMLGYYSRTVVIVIVIVNSIFLQRPQNRGRGNQLIHRRLSKTKSIGSGSDPESQAGRQSVRRLWWMVFGVETWREVGGRGQIRIGFVEELWRDSKGWGFCLVRIGWGG